MSINEMLDLLKEANRKLEQANITDDAKFELEGLIIQTKREIIRHSVDPLRDISNMTVVDVSKLRALIPELVQSIQDEQKRVSLLTKIISIAKGGLRAAGIPIVSGLV